MLSRKSSCAGMMMTAAGVDRGRVGERLQAALAGLQELHLLRDRQGEMVSWALQVDREEPVSSVRTEPPRSPTAMGAEEQRLEATLTALKQQLSRLRKQDVGLKTHLQQLDQQISELKLDVSKASTEQLESDSRPSSGFYELSDGGSCSLSNSCTSVYSECLSSSQTSLFLVPTSPANCHVGRSPQVDACRRRSADESAAHPTPQRGAGFHLGSSRIRASATGAEQARPRPVSTGDLDRMMAQGPTSYKTADAKKPPLCTSHKTTAMDPKFQRNLESRSGTEVYHYPSPLHAVALQSPIFFHGRETATPGGLQAANGYDSLQRTHDGYETKTLGYIDKILQRGVSKIQSETDTESLNTHVDYRRKSIEDVIMSSEASQKKITMQKSPAVKMTSVNPLDGEQKRRGQESMDHTTHKQPVGAPEVLYRFSYPAAVKEYTSDENSYSSLKKNEKLQTGHGTIERSWSENRCADKLESGPQERSSHRQRAAMVHSSTAEESRVFEAHGHHAALPEFVHAKFVPAGSHKVKVRQADRKTKAVKLKRKSSEKPRATRTQLNFNSAERTRETKGEQRRSGRAKPSQREEHRHGSGSDCCPHSPGLVCTQRGGHPRPHPVSVAVKSSRSRRPQCLEYEPPVEQRKRRQTGAKWPSDVDVFQASCAQCLRSKEPQGRGPGTQQMVRSVSARPGQWIGSARPFHSSVSSNSFFQSLNARYPAAPFQTSSRYPPRCESEYSAECASLFHSTIAESSEGELSDNTTNRFGDSESSQSFQSLSDSDSSVSPDDDDQLDEEEEEEVGVAGGGLVWADAALGPTAAGQPLRALPARPEPAACRIKASRALKKKIRRFQPASLKVMTLV